MLHISELQKLINQYGYKNLVFVFDIMPDEKAFDNHRECKIQRVAYKIKEYNPNLPLRSSQHLAFEIDQNVSSIVQLLITMSLFDKMYVYPYSICKDIDSGRIQIYVQDIDGYTPIQTVIKNVD